jgi:hypothetical protein
MKKLLLFIFLFPLFAFAQQYNSDVKQQMKELAKKQIKELHDGCLLVRLHRNEASINALLKAGQTKQAEKVKNNLDQMNQNIVSAFNSNFSFCPVYFFYAEHSDSILNKNFDKIILDSNFQITDVPLLKGKKFFVAEICKTAPDTLTLVDSYKYKGTSSEDTVMKKTYYETSATHMNSLVIKSDRFIQLSRPFPYYVNIAFTDGVPSANKIKRTVNKMNHKLYNYYR